MSTVKSNSSNRKKITIGLVGFGVVGKGLYDVLQDTPTLDAEIKRICIKDPAKKRTLPATHFTTNIDEILNDESINTVVELIDDAEAAFLIVSAALQKSKSVVSANKKMIAAHFEELLQLQNDFGGAFLYESACCASIPVIRNLEEYYDNDMLSSIKGIVNGSTNYILTKIFEEGLSFPAALQQAQALGFAESNPALDVGGHDAANKLCILLAHGFGCIAKPADILYSGITAITASDATIAKQRNWKVKLVATAKKISENKIAAFVLPQFVDATDELAGVSNEYNGLITESSFADRHFFKGKGAGAYPTAAAVLSDIAALRYHYKYEYKKIYGETGLNISKDYSLRVYVSAGKQQNIPRSSFEHIEEWHDEINCTWAIGSINAAALFNEDWWQQPGISLILCSGPVYQTAIVKKEREEEIYA